MMKIYVTAESESGEKIFNFPLSVMTFEDREHAIELFRMIAGVLSKTEGNVQTLAEAVTETAKYANRLEYRIAALENEGKILL